MPNKHGELSVNRHREAKAEETWAIGRHVAATREKTLYGLADIRASSCRIAPLDVVSKPVLPENPNHADIVRFPPPPRKDEQLSLAQKLAAAIEGKWKTPLPTDGNERDKN